MPALQAPVVSVWSAFLEWSSRMSSIKPAAARQQSLFDPKTGAFAGNIRDIGGDDSELRESLKELGWIKEFPALVDENGVVLVGHRRMKIAEEENIEPAIKNLNLGKGDAADAKRLRLAIVSNIGSKPMTPEDRKRIAEHLYGEREWTMERIAEALNVSTRQISKDLEGFEPSSKPPRPKGGRPKGSRSRKKPGPAPNTKETPAPQAPPVEPANSDSIAPSPPIAADKTDLVESEQREPEREPVINPPATGADGSPKSSFSHPAKAIEPTPPPSAAEPDEPVALRAELTAIRAAHAALQAELAALRAALAAKLSECEYDLVNTLWALHNLNLTGDIAEKNLPDIVKAKPPFGYLGLIDLGKAIADLGHAWKLRAQQQPTQNGAVPPINDFDGVSDFLRQPVGADAGNASKPGSSGERG